MVVKKKKKEFELDPNLRLQTQSAGRETRQDVAEGGFRAIPPDVPSKPPEKPKTEQEKLKSFEFNLDPTQFQQTEEPKTDTGGAIPPMRDPITGAITIPESFSPSAVDPRTGRVPEGGIVRGVNLEQQRREAFQDVTGSGQLATGLEEQIINQPSLQPTSIFSQVGQGGGINTPVEKALAGLAIAGVAGIAAFSIFGVPALFAASAIKGIAAKNALSITGVFGLSAIFGGKQLVSEAIQGKRKIGVLKSEISKAGELSSTTLSAVENGMDPISALDSLTQSVNAINEAEAQIKQLGIYNINFRLDRQYIEIQATIKKSRQEILERVLAIESIAATGRKNPENKDGLMINLLELEKLK